LTEQKVKDTHTVKGETNQTETNEVEVDEAKKSGSEEEAKQNVEQEIVEPEIIVDEESSIDELRAKLGEAEKKAEENYQKYLRAQADFDNFRRRARKEKEDQASYASLPVIEQFLPALDNFERALASSKETRDAESLAKGVEMVLRQMEQVLTTEGLEVISTIGEAFDPTVHQAVMQVESEEFEAGTVVEELQKGYKLKDRVIRPAMVKVSS
jgi:molecular chaperone GrpE